MIPIISKDIIKAYYIAACESVLLYGSVTWTLTNALEKRLDGTYTKMLRMVLGPHGRTRSAI